MKKALIFAISLCLVLPSCKDDTAVLKDKSIKSMIPGVWRVESVGGTPVLTDETMVLEFHNEGQVECAFAENPKKVNVEEWLRLDAVPYTVKRHKLHVDFVSDPLHIGKDFTVEKLTPYHMTLGSEHGSLELKRVFHDYQASVLGLWAGMEMEGATYSDADHLWSYLPDGNYGFFMKNDRGIWYKSHDLKSDYRVRGDVLFTHWTNPDGEDFVENWIVDGIRDGYMKWTALRDGGVRNEFLMERMINDPKESLVPLITDCEWVLEELTLDDLPTTVDGIVSAFGFTGADSGRSFGNKMVFNTDMTVDVTYSDGKETLLYLVIDNMIYTDTMNGLPLIMNYNPLSDTIVGALNFDDRLIQIIYKKVK